MRRYETIFIADPDLQDGARKNLFEKFTSLLGQEGGLLVKFEDWGNKKLAYEINKKARGHYVCMTYGGNGEVIKELERNFRLDENIMKFMTILLEKDVDTASLEEEIAAGSEDKTASAPPENTSDADTSDSDERSDVAEATIEEEVKESEDVEEEV